MTLDNKVIKSMIATPVVFIVLKDSNISKRFYNNNYPSAKDELLTKDIEILNLKLDNNIKRVTSFIALDNILNKLYSKTSYKDKFFFVFRENMFSIIYINNDLYQELIKNISILNNTVSLHADNRIDIILIKEK